MSHDLYHQELKQLAQAENGAGSLSQPDASVTLDNPLCGDRVTLELKMTDGRIAGLAHHVRGCLLCRAAASAIGAAAQGSCKEDISAVETQLSDMLKEAKEIDWSEPWRPLSLFQSVQTHKSRHNCVLLPFKALWAAFERVSAK